MGRVYQVVMGEGFRVFFLAAAMTALISMGLWLLWLAGADGVLASVAPTPSHWHAHELIFGYGAATLGGFFLTAVPNWTGAKAAPQRFIATVAGIWLAGRIVIFLSAALPVGLVAIVDLAFAPVLMLKIAQQLRKRPKPQNIAFLVFLFQFWVANIMLHATWIDPQIETASAGLAGGLMSLVGMILVLGGRVTPAFTRNAMHRAGIEKGEPNEKPMMAPVSIALGALLPLVAMTLHHVALSGLVFVIAGLFALARVAIWHTRFQWSQPILWALHVSYGLIGLGLVLYGVAVLGFGDRIAGLHFLAIGGVGGMTIAVMSRATLGHSGRPLVAPRLVVAAYALIPITAASRWAGVMVFPAQYNALLMASGVLWLLAFGGFLLALWTVFVTPRAPRAPVGPPPS